MDLKELLIKNRSYRRFYNEKKISIDELKEMVELVRYTNSAANRQVVRFRLVADDKTNAIVYDKLGWAGYLKDWDGPKKEERPSAYIVLLTKKEDKADIDEGIICQAITLSAVAKGMGACILGNVKREDLLKSLNIDEAYKLDLVIALGYPKEEVEIVDVKDGDIKYYRDEKGKHYVPKRSLEDLLI